MASLLDAINQGSSQMAGQQQGVTGVTDQVAQLQRAKGGTAGQGGPYATSALGENQAVASTNQTLASAVAPAAALQQSQLQTSNQGQEQAAQQAKASTAQQSSALQTQTASKLDATLAQAAQAKGSVDTQRYASSMEQAGFQLRLQNQQYVQTLQQNASLGRLQDEGNFKQQLAASTFGDNQALLEKRLGDQAVLDSSENQFRDQLANLDIGTAYDMLGNELKGQAERQLFTGAGALATAGIGYAASPASPAGKTDPGAPSNTGITATNSPTSSPSSVEPVA